MNSAVLDASALLAFLGGEPGAGLVEQSIAGGGYLSSVNWVEVLAKLSDRGLNPVKTDKTLRASGLIGAAIEIVMFTEADALTAAQFGNVTRAGGLSLGDRSCLALAMALGLPAVTADRSWLSLGLKVKIQVIR